MMNSSVSEFPHLTTLVLRLPLLMVPGGVLDLSLIELFFYEPQCARKDEDDCEQ